MAGVSAFISSIYFVTGPMNFLVFTAISGMVLFSAPLLIGFKLSKKWNLPKRLFWKAGLALLIIEIFHLEVVGNASALWPNLFESSLVLKIFLLGIINGLFFELGRFLVLDKFIRQCRSYKEAVFFGLGWAGLETILIGIIAFFSVFGIQTLLNNPDLQKVFPDASTQEIQELQSFKDQTLALVQNNPVLALAPILERFAQMLIDIALTLLIVLALVKGLSKLIWIAVAFRSIFVGLLVYTSTVNVFAVEIVFVIFGLIGFFLLRECRKFFPEYLK